MSSFPILNISHLIPQKYPIVMVDTLVEFSPESLTSSLTIKADNIFHSNNCLQEPGIIENMAQTVALHTGYDYFLKNMPAPVGYIGSIKKVEIFSLPKLNETISTNVKILQEFLGVTLVNIEVLSAEGKIYATGQMKTVVAK